MGLSPFHGYPPSSGYALPPPPNGCIPPPSPWGQVTNQTTPLPAIDLNPRVKELKSWCTQVGLGDEEFQGLNKLGYRVGESLDAITLGMWEYAGLGPLHQVRISGALNQYLLNSTSNSGS
jgi:hypothetical protein